MTTVPMPKPLGYVSARLLREFAESSSEPDVDLHIEQLPFANRSPSGMNAVALITTTQAEAYAAAKVREALELAAQTCENQGRATTTLDGESFYIALGQAARAIRALIPPLPGPVEPTT